MLPGHHPASPMPPPRALGGALTSGGEPRVVGVRAALQCPELETEPEEGPDVPKSVCSTVSRLRPLCPDPPRLCPLLLPPSWCPSPGNLPGFHTQHPTPLGTVRVHAQLPTACLLGDAGIRAL